jgi:CheY-like chemotaxis protein
MSEYRVLLVGSEDRVPLELPQAIERDSARSIAAEASTAIHDALERIAQKGYDAVVCWAEREDELAGVIRIRKKRPELPILILTSRVDPAFSRVARHAGATRTERALQDVGKLSEFIRLLVRSGELRKELLEGLKRVQSQALELQQLAEQTGLLTRDLRSRLRPPTPKGFVPLVIEDNPDQAFLMLRAFQQADVFAPLPILRSGEEAIEYLSGRGAFEKIRRLPFPSIVLLDVELPGKSGLEILEWIRQQPKFSSLPVVMLSAAMDAGSVKRAYELGANSYLAKPSGFEALVDVILNLKRYWGTMNEAPGP